MSDETENAGIDDTTHASKGSSRWVDEWAGRIVSDHFAEKSGLQKQIQHEFFQAGAQDASRSPELRTRLVELEEVARATFQSRDEANRWFDTPKPVALKHLTPRQYLTNTSGCDVVERLMRELRS